MARWTRAARALDLPPRSGVLDLGCAFGFGTRYLLPRYQAHGHDLSERYIEQARRSLPGVPFTVGPADAVPYPDCAFDGVLLLDVLEHVPDDRAVAAECARLLRPGGRLVLSAPNRGLLERLDSLNLYHRLTGGAPTDDPSWPAVQWHRHYSASELDELLGPEFQIEWVRYTGAGIAEAVNLVLLLTLRRAPRAYEIAQYLYFGLYLLEDLMPTGRWGYHLMLGARRV